MTDDSMCDSFPDIYQQPPPPGDPNYDKIVRANEAHRKVYQAARYILINDFRPGLAIPLLPQDFPGNVGDLSEAEIAMVTAVHGMLISDNWDPTMGKSKPSQGDLTIDVNGSRMVVDRRFIDATVAAVKEYTSENDLFNQCFELLKTEAETKPPGPPSPGGYSSRTGSPKPQVNPPAGGTALPQVNQPAAGAHPQANR